MFKVKDLMIKIVPAKEGEREKGVCHYCTSDCTEACTDACSPAITCKVCSIWHTDCGECTHGETAACIVPETGCDKCNSGCSCLSGKTKGGGEDAGREILGLEGLETLRRELRARLAKVEREIEVQEELSKPRSIEAAEILEQKLSEALEEVKQIRSDLERKNTGK